MDTFLKYDDIWCLSISSTGRCNCSCSYCHVYARHEQKDYTMDISDEMFDNIIETIALIKEKYHKNIQVRFSGGEPLILGDRLFEMTERLYQRTGFEPAILSNGLMVNEEVIERASKSHISAFVCSIENPFDPAVGAANPEKVLEIINKFKNAAVEVLPGVMIIKNKSFKDLKKISDYVYGKIGMLPVYSELSFQAYESPTEIELKELHDNIKAIAKEYYGKTPLRLFPYVSPELHSNGERNFITSIELEDETCFAKGPIESAKMLFDRLNNSYINPLCKNKNCDWSEDCQLVKWTWLNETKRISKEVKFFDFCSLKKCVNNALFDGIMEKEESADERITD